jgi:hypothetical protein
MAAAMTAFLNDKGFAATEDAAFATSFAQYRTPSCSKLEDRQKYDTKIENVLVQKVQVRLHHSSSEGLCRSRYKRFFDTAYSCSDWRYSLRAAIFNLGGLDQWFLIDTIFEMMGTNRMKEGN